MFLKQNFFFPRGKKQKNAHGHRSFARHGGTVCVRARVRARVWFVFWFVLIRFGLFWFVEFRLVNLVWFCFSLVQFGLVVLFLLVWLVWFGQV